MTENISGASPKIKFRREIHKVNMVIVDRPKNPVVNGKNRMKFPTAKDCCVRIEVKIGGKENVMKVSYNQKRHILDEKTQKRKANGTKYLLEVSCITRHPINNNSLFDEPLSMMCLQRPLNYLNQFNKSDFGFWFRFFGKSCRFHIKISLKTQRGNPERGAEEKVVSTLELDIVNREIISHKNITKQFEKPARECTLYSEKEYQLIMQKLQSLEDNCLWEKCRSAANRLLSELDETKSDYKVCILLEQSKMSCQQGKWKDAKSLVKTALEMIPTTSRNKALLTARAYICLSLSHQYDQAFDNAEACLRIAKTKLFDFMACEDTGDFYYQEGRILLGFIFRSPIAHRELVNAAKEKVEMAVCHFRKSFNSEGAAIMNKMCSAQIYIAILLVLGNKGDSSIVNADQIISSMAEICASLNWQTKCKFNFATALLQEQNSDIKAALEYAKTALELANKSGLYLEKQWIEDLIRRLSKIEDEESLLCCMPHCDTCTVNFASDSQSVYEADGSGDVEW